MINIKDLEISDYVEYLSEVKKVDALPNNDVDEVAEILTDYGFTMGDVLFNAKNYRRNDDVLWIKGMNFGTLSWWELEEQFGNEVIAWLESRKNTEC